MVADRGLITDDNIAEVEAAKCDWLFATKLRRRKDVAAVLATAAEANESDWVEVERFGSKVLETSYNGRRYVVVFSAARERRDIARRLQLVAKIETKLLALEARVARGKPVAATDIAAAAATILARSPVKRLFDVSNIADGRLVYDYDHDAMAYDETLAGHYVLATSLTPRAADAEQVLAAYRSLQHVEFPGCSSPPWGSARSATSPKPGSVGTSPSACSPPSSNSSSTTGYERRPTRPRPRRAAPVRRAGHPRTRPIRQGTLTAGAQTITAITRRTSLQQQILAGLGVDTAAWTRPTITG